MPSTELNPSLTEFSWSEDLITDQNPEHHISPTRQITHRHGYDFLCCCDLSLHAANLICTKKRHAFFIVIYVSWNQMTNASISSKLKPHAWCIHTSMSHTTFVNRCLQSLVSHKSKPEWIFYRYFLTRNAISWPDSWSHNNCQCSLSACFRLSCLQVQPCTCCGQLSTERHYAAFARSDNWLFFIWVPVILSSTWCYDPECKNKCQRTKNPWKFSLGHITD